MLDLVAHELPVVLEVRRRERGRAEGAAHELLLRLLLTVGESPGGLCRRRPLNGHGLQGRRARAGVRVDDVGGLRGVGGCRFQNLNGGGVAQEHLYLGRCLGFTIHNKIFSSLDFLQNFGIGSIQLIKLFSEN